MEGSNTVDAVDRINFIFESEQRSSYLQKESPHQEGTEAADGEPLTKKKAVIEIQDDATTSTRPKEGLGLFRYFHAQKSRSNIILCPQYSPLAPS